MRKRITYEDIKNRMKEKGLEIIEGSYTDFNHEWYVTDENGYKLRCVKSTYYSDAIPFFVDNKNKYVVDNIKTFLKNNDYGCKLISEEFKSSTSPLTFKCLKCGKDFTDSWNKISQKSSDKYCKECNIKLRSEKTRVSLREAKEMIKDMNLTIAEETYECISKPCLGFTEDGYKVLLNANTFRKNQFPPIFSNTNPYTIDNIKRYIKINKLEVELISSEYVSSSSPLEFRCAKCGEKFETTFSKIKEGKINCMKCRIENGEFIRTDIEKIREMLDELDCDLVSTEYIGETSPIEFVCRKHRELGIQTTNKKNIRRGQACHECGRINSLHSREVPDEEIKKLTEEKGFIFVGTTYEYGKKSILYKCKKHLDKGVFVKSHLNMKTLKGGCPYCTTYYNEDKMIQLLEEWDYHVETQKCFEDCRDVSYLRFDAFLTDFNTAVEYDGEQHYKPVAWGNMSKEEAEQELLNVQRRDKIKDDYCKEKGIKLIRIPYWKSEYMEEYLFDELVKNGVIEEITTAS